MYYGIVQVAGVFAGFFKIANHKRAMVLMQVKRNYFKNGKKRGKFIEALYGYFRRNRRRDDRY